MAYRFDFQKLYEDQMIFAIFSWIVFTFVVVVAILALGLVRFSVLFGFVHNVTEWHLFRVTVWQDPNDSSKILSTKLERKQRRIPCFLPIEVRKG